MHEMEIKGCRTDSRAREPKKERDMPTKPNILGTRILSREECDTLTHVEGWIYTCLAHGHEVHSRYPSTKEMIFYVLVVNLGI